MSANLPCDHQSGIDSNMQTKLGPVGVIEGSNRVHHIKSSSQGALGVVFVRHRRTKYRHDFIANELVDSPVVFLHHWHQPVEAGVDQVPNFFGI